MAFAQIKRSEPYFTWESFFIGGLSIVTCIGCWAFVEKSTNLMTMSQLAFGLAFIVNHPHFLSSYHLLYGDFRKDILRKPRYFWAGIIVPAILFGAFIFAFQTQSLPTMAALVNVMYFTVGWHYTKQVFGCVIVTSARRKMYFTKYERRVLLANLFSLWAISFLRAQAGAQNYEFYGIKYGSSDLPLYVVDIAYYFAMFTGALLVHAGIRKYINEGKFLNSSALMAIVALYVWYLPVFSHPHFGYLIPLFHSLQYLTFVHSFKKNQVTHKSLQLSAKEKREVWMKRFVGFFISSTVLGAIFFEFLPKGLDSSLQFHSATIGNTPFIAAFLLFINIHHYFIDNVMWRSDNEEIKAHLFSNGEVDIPLEKSRAA